MTAALAYAVEPRFRPAARRRRGPRLIIRPLPEYEPPTERLPPDGDPDAAEEDWPNLYPATGPQLTLVLPVTERPASQERDDRDATDLGLRRMMTVVLEVLDGHRPVGQLRTLLTNPAYESLLTRVRASTARHRLRSLYTCRPADGVIELCATVNVTTRDGRRRVLAAAGRVELTRRGWRCTVLRML
ncbi:hypothetical protein EV193_110152 [Herbihabitans rhizosphaerae]|uniref:Uncharacterized protein n=1 Tax=Herbihabitans rhizosphaerae TaxID=1872711 RepID=A0A4Q7KFL3_9PSEU|nr:Rv3235 family protein [Herbihabitans rhizosphaerae]RZS34002.1 hypothetical protein EV193_110152 [Herbihabitans rhizosphaerae]